MSGEVQVSVVVPTCNGGRLLERTLHAALGQEAVDLEIVVVDDGSTDGTPDRVAAIADGRLRLIRQDHSEGPSCARNVGIGHARGRWIAFLDHDDVWAPHKLRTQLEVAAREGATFVYCAAVRVDARLAVLRIDAPAVEPRDLASSLLQANGIAGGASGPIADAALVRSVGGFDPGLRYMEDWDLWIRLASVGVAAVCQEPLLAYVVHPGSMLLTESPDLDRELSYLAAKHVVLMDAAGSRPNGLETYRWLAWSHWIAGRRLAALHAYAVGMRRHATATHLRFAVAQAFRGASETMTRQREQVEWLQRMRRSV